MAINTSEIGNTPNDMTNWDPDRTDEVVPQSDAVESDASLEPPARPRPSVIARQASPAPVAPTSSVSTDRTIPIPAQRPTATPTTSQMPPTISQMPPAAPQMPSHTSKMPSHTSKMPPATSAQPKSQLPPRTEWLGTETSATTAPQTAPAVRSFGASSPPPLRAQAAPPSESPRKVGWLWPAIAAFVLGGLLTGLGFRIGSQTIEGTDETVAPTTVTTNVIPPVQAPAPGNTGEEPAAFVAGKLGPSVVTVETDRGLGSGVIFDDGLILTNNHVIEGAAQIQVRLANGGLLPAELVGSDPRTDIAVVSVGEGRNLPIADLALGQELEVGELAIAIGSPFQLQQTVTAGIISALNRPVQNGLGFTAMIQTDAPINPGNSGGALANREGELIGINTSIQTAGDSSNAGVGFAVPIDTAYNVAQRILSGEELVGGFLGVGGGASADGSSGVEVTSLTPDSGADLAGIREGDRIISIDGAPVVNLEQLAGIVSTRFPGEDIEIGLVRGTQELVIVATLGER